MEENKKRSSTTISLCWLLWQIADPRLILPSFLGTERDIHMVPRILCSWIWPCTGILTNRRRLEVMRVISATFLRENRFLDFALFAWLLAGSKWGGASALITQEKNPLRQGFSLNHRQFCFPGTPGNVWRCVLLFKWGVRSQLLASGEGRSQRGCWTSYKAQKSPPPRRLSWPQMSTMLKVKSFTVRPPSQTLPKIIPQVSS